MAFFDASISKSKTNQEDAGLNRQYMNPKNESCIFLICLLIVTSKTSITVCTIILFFTFLCWSSELFHIFGIDNPWWITQGKQV